MSLAFIILAFLSFPLHAEIYEDHTVPSCQGENNESAGCFWWLKAPLIQLKKYDDLVIFFAGGDQACVLPIAKRGAVYGAVANQYLESNILFVCANVYDSVDLSRTGKYPFYTEAHRVEKLMASILSDRSLLSKWSGKNLLFSGVSHGASTPPVAFKVLAPSTVSYWKGSQKTAACFLDGEFDVLFTGKWALRKAENTGSRIVRQDCEDSFERQICQRYFGFNSCSADSYSHEMEIDTLVDTSTRKPNFNLKTYPFKHWRITECGSALPSCSAVYGDGLPSEPQKAFCDALNATPGRCEFNSLAIIPHSGCVLYPTAGDACISWFQRLPND